MSAWVGRSPGRPFARIPRAIPAGRVPRICGDVKGSEVSLGRFFQNLLVESKVVGLQQNGTVLVIERSGCRELLPEDVIR